MSSRTGAPRGDQLPFVRLVPVAVDDSDADDAILLGTSYGLTPDEWQETILRAWLGRRRDGKWASATAGLACPRQNGKNAVVEIRELFGIITLGERWLHTAHEVKTARKAFVRLASFFENARKYPELAELVKEIRRANGQEAIVLTNGGSVEFVARSKGSGRGFTVDCLLLDEAQELSEEALEALVPTTSSGPLGNPQTIYTGTPPGPKSVGEVFTRIHDAGHAGTEKRLCWLEWSAPKGCDLDDREQWARANPALGYRLHTDVIVTERSMFDDAGFARERLGIWDDRTSGKSGITTEMWGACGDTTSEIVDTPVMALDVSPARWTAISLAGHNADGLTHVEVPEFRAGTDWAVSRAVDIAARWGVTSVSLDPTGPAGALLPAFEAAGVAVTLLGARDMAQACGLFFNLVSDAQLRHLDDDFLNLAVAGATRRPLGDAWAWARRTSLADIAPLVAATVAVRAASVAPEAIDVSLSVW